MKEKFTIEKWTPENFAEKLTEIVLEPTLGDGQSEIKIEDDSLTVKIKVFPFQKSGIDINDKSYCTYTEGLIETAAKNALNVINFKSEHLKATGADACIFKIKINK